jgi:hypothetical protein
MFGYQPNHSSTVGIGAFGYISIKSHSSHLLISQLTVVFNSILENEQFAWLQDSADLELYHSRRGTGEAMYSKIVPFSRIATDVVYY